MKKSGFFKTSANVDEFQYNVLDSRESFRTWDDFPIKAVGSNERFPFFVLSRSGLGILIKTEFLNGKGWTEDQRSRFLSSLEEKLSVTAELNDVVFTYSFTMMRRNIKKSTLDHYQMTGTLQIFKARRQAFWVI